MAKIMLTVAALAALGMNDHPNEGEVSGLSAAVEALNQKYEAEKTARVALQQKLEASQKLQAEELVNKAVADGRISPTETETLEQLKAKFVSMAVTDYGLATSILSMMQPKANLNSSVNNPAAAGAGMVKTQDDFQKLTLAQQLEFKNSHPEAYKQLFA